MIRRPPRSTLFPYPPLSRSLSEVLDSLRRHIFNDVVFPDFTRLPTVNSAPLAYHAFDEEKAFTADNLDVTAVRVNHIVPTAGFIVRQGDSALLYSGDTSEKIGRASCRERV